MCTPAHERLIAHSKAEAARSSGSLVRVVVVDHLDDIAGQLRRMGGDRPAPRHAATNGDATGRARCAWARATHGHVWANFVKATSTPRPEDFRWLAYLRDRLDSAQGEFTAGVVLHTGPRRLPFGDRLVALPASDLWS
ncbi:MAG: hypothetical protein ACRDSL_23545 [Pseudonocardiaceae bacterium]